MAPANDNELDLVEGVLACSFDELMDALRSNGADVRRGLVTDDGFVEQAND